MFTFSLKRGERKKRDKWGGGAKDLFQAPQRGVEQVLCGK
jgi:hypothetical protein